MSASITKKGTDLMNKITFFHLGGHPKNKRYRYSNGIKLTLRRKKHKTSRSQSNLSRRFFAYKRKKETSHGNQTRRKAHSQAHRQARR